MVPEINSHRGEWILLEGQIRGVDEAHDREISTFLRGVFVARRDVRKLRTRFLAQKYPGNDTIPEGATDHYVYAGEAGRRQTYARFLWRRDGRYRRQVAEALERHVTVNRPRKTAPAAVNVEPLPSESGDGGRRAWLDVLRPLGNTRRVPGVSLECPFIHFGWESYHSSINDFSGFDLPAPSLIERLGLASRNREVDFYDSAGRPATLYRESGDGWVGERHSFLFIRADLLRRYLTETRQVLVWCNWGERDWLSKKDGGDVIRDTDRHRIYQAYRHIHKTVREWSPQDCGG